MTDDAKPTRWGLPLALLVLMLPITAKAEYVGTGLPGDFISNFKQLDEFGAGATWGCHVKVFSSVRPNGQLFADLYPLSDCAHKCMIFMPLSGTAYFGNLNIDDEDHRVIDLQIFCTPLEGK